MTVTLTERDMRAWVTIMERLREDEQRAHQTRLRIAHELGFDARHPSDVKVGDTIRDTSGLWFEVVSRARVVDPPDGHPYWRFGFGDANGTLEIEDWSEDHPILPSSVLVAIPPSEEPF